MRSAVSCWFTFAKRHYMVTLVLALIIYFPRIVLSFLVFFLAVVVRRLGSLLGIVQGRDVANRRILFISDYMPPQAHGIAVRSHAYVTEMRKHGHMVISFSTAMDSKKATSFDHPNIPSLVNPFNRSNRVGYNPGVKLAWYLGNSSWDIVHIVFPSVIAWFVLLTCSWRGIPTYCSHHVAMNHYYRAYSVKPVCAFATFMYGAVAKWPASLLATRNAAPTLAFAREHLGCRRQAELRQVPSGTHDLFEPKLSNPTEREEIRREVFNVDSDDVKVFVMIQRLSPEKNTRHVFSLLEPKENSLAQGFLALHL